MEEIKIFYGKNKIKIPKDSNFLMLKEKILKKDKRLVKHFIYENEKINDNLLIINYPIFNVVIDKNDFCEFKKGQFRCKKCRKYLKLSNFTCQHYNFCRAYYNFKKKESIYEILEGGYEEEESQKRDFLDEEESQKGDFCYAKDEIAHSSFKNDDDYELINKILNKYDERNKKIKINKINRILLNNKVKEKKQILYFPVKIEEQPNKEFMENGMINYNEKEEKTGINK